ncbi:MAG: hypothetical protein GY737_27555 [Desulfobacteraceae bacterium]|nr:hypothetical protein [Desulfobacteraceae bacterium]
MELEDLIQKLTRDILQQLNDETEPGTGGGAEAKTQSETVLIFGKKEDTYTEPLLSLINSNARILFLDEDWRDKAIDRYVLPLLTLGQMGELAQGTARGRIGGEVLTTVLSGKTVEVVQYGYTYYMETAPEPLLRLYETQKETLKGFGIKEFEPMAKDLLRSRKRVVTETEVKNARDKGASTLQVPADACITPLAEEFARDNSIEILKR